MSIFERVLPSLKLEAQIERWPIAGSFKISRGEKTEAEVVTVTVSDGEITGHGECVPYSRYKENVSDVLKEIQSYTSIFEQGIASPCKINFLLEQHPAACNAIDSAIWDYLAKANQIKTTELAEVSPLTKQTTAYTISLDSPEVMFNKARDANKYSLLKIKLGKDGDEVRMQAVRQAAPNARLIADANEGWAPEDLPGLLNEAKRNGFELVEQPLPENRDAILSEIDHPIPICADESCHDWKGLDNIVDRYDAINIKLDKTGGLRNALHLAREAKKRNLKIMVGCMVGTSLSMAPALYLAEFADWIDLDGPLLLSKDRVPGLVFEGSEIFPPEPALWGY